jgi:hypothetical protein
MFRFVGPDGVEIANGPLSLLDEALRARSTAEGAIAAAARAAGQMARIQARSDALDLKERDLEAREDACRAIQADAVRRFCDSVLELSHRFDAFEQRSIQAKLDALPDPDRPADDGDLEMKPPRDEDPLEDALAFKGDQGDLPEELLAKAPPPLGSFVPGVDPEDPRSSSGKILAPAPEVSLSSDRADGISRADFTCGRDYRRAKRQARLEARSCR